MLTWIKLVVKTNWIFTSSGKQMIIILFAVSDVHLRPCILYLDTSNSNTLFEWVYILTDCGPPTGSGVYCMRKACWKVSGSCSDHCLIIAKEFHERKSSRLHLNQHSLRGQDNKNAAASDWVECALVGLWCHREHNLIHNHAGSHWAETDCISCLPFTLRGEGSVVVLIPVSIF